jgi:hypothetical protein
MGKTTVTYHDKSEYTRRPTFRTEKFGSLLSDTYQGEVHQNDDKTWSGWFTNFTNPRSYAHPTAFRLDFASRSAAARWVNGKLRDAGIK